ncbi:MAG TPA: tRNA uracil 4-sulfurtransferase ThiI [Methanothrix sp.]|nr:tRNA uracil 4-sulfurtransferase ThiI [Methanothrix sp.]HPJ84952.1 tRNA uracil 4-sulfurtransferase ThiI [Methanothrix sp.]
MTSFDSVLVRYGEIALKDPWTRKSWERTLASNIVFNLKEAGIDHALSLERGRIFVSSSDPRAPGVIADVFGVVSTSPVWTVEPDIAAVEKVASEIAVERRPQSFAIRSRRGGGEISSTEIAVEVGRAVQERTGAKVDLTNPELEIFVEAREKKVFVFTDVVRGVGGLPLGTQSRMLALISGGIDSPVAAWMMMRRGCPISLLYFDPRPYVDALPQAKKSAEALRRWTSGRKINFIQVPIGDGLAKISEAEPRATCLLCRRLMYRIAQRVMEEEEAFGVVTGYSLGQVASQTPANIMAEQSGIDLPVYHPLIAMDKSEITDLARKIGTYRATADAGSCSAAPKKPMTRAKAEEIRAMEAELGLEEMARELFEKRERMRI